MHKFHLGQAVEYRAPRGVDAPRGAYLVTAKLERDGQFEYRIRSVSEPHERMARESELQAVIDNEALSAHVKAAPGGWGKRT
jgi:hypothetical protein